MIHATEILKLYTPVQPTVKQSANNVIYAEFLPDIRLQNYIFCYWELKTTQILQEQFVYRVVSDGCIDIFFELPNPENSFVMGFSEQYTEFPLENSFHYIGVRFLPSVFPQLFKVNAAELTNRFENLGFVVDDMSRFIESAFKVNDNQITIKSTFDKYFLHKIYNSFFNDDKRFYQAIYQILEKNGDINVETDLDTGISPRQLRRLFNFYIGSSAKTFGKVIRFQNILNARPSSGNLKHNKMFFDAGYYDQAHFIKEFRNFYGITPGKAFD